MNLLQISKGLEHLEKDTSSISTINLVEGSCQFI